MKEVTCPNCGEYFYWQPEEPACPGCGKRLRVAAKKERTLIDVSSRVGGRPMLDWVLPSLALLVALFSAALAFKSEAAHPELTTFGTIPADLIAFPEIEVLLRPTGKELQDSLPELVEKLASGTASPEEQASFEDILYQKKAALQEPQLDRYIEHLAKHSLSQKLTRILSLPRSQVLKEHGVYDRSVREKIVMSAIAGDDLSLQEAALNHALVFELQGLWPVLFQKLERDRIEGRESPVIAKLLRESDFDKWRGFYPELRACAEIVSDIDNDKVLWIAVDQRMRAGNRSAAYVRGLDHILSKRWPAYVNKLKPEQLTASVGSIVVKEDLERPRLEHRIDASFLHYLPAVMEKADIWIPLLQKSAEMTPPPQPNAEGVTYSMNTILRRWQGLPEAETMPAETPDFSKLIEWVAAADRKMVQERFDQLVASDKVVSREAGDAQDEIVKHFRSLTEEQMRAAIPEGETVDEALMKAYIKSAVWSVEAIRKDQIARGHDPVSLYLRTMMWERLGAVPKEWNCRELDLPTLLQCPSLYGFEQSLGVINQQHKFGVLDKESLSYPALYAQLISGSPNDDTSSSQFKAATFKLLDTLNRIDSESVRPLLTGQLLSMDRDKQAATANLLATSGTVEDERLLINALKSSITRGWATNVLSKKGAKLLEGLYELAAEPNLDDQTQLSICYLLSIFGDAESPLKVAAWTGDENPDVRAATELLISSIEAYEADETAIWSYLKLQDSRVKRTSDELLTQLAGDDPNQQLEALVLLHESETDPAEHEKIAAAVLQFVESAESTTQFFARALHGRACDQESAARLINVVRNPPDHRQLLAACDSLLHRSDVGNIPALVEMLQDQKLVNFGRACLIRIGLDHPEEVTEAVVPMIRQEDPEQALEAAIILASFGWPANQALLDEVGKKHPCIAYYASVRLRTLLQETQQRQKRRMEAKNAASRQ